jgi:hypothetical protein
LRVGCIRGSRGGGSGADVLCVLIDGFLLQRLRELRGVEFDDRTIPVRGRHHQVRSVLRFGMRAEGLRFRVYRSVQFSI